MGAYFKGRKIGYVHSLTEKGRLNGDPVIRVGNHAHVDMEVQGEKRLTRLDQECYLDRDGNLHSFNYDQSIMGHRLVVRGKRRGDELVVEIDAGGSKRKKTFKVTNDLYTSGLIKYALLKEKLGAGDEREFDILLEPLLAVEKIHIKVLEESKGYVDGKDTTILTVEENFKGITGILRLTADGRTIEELSPQGFRLLPVSREEAKTDVAPLPITELLTASRIDVEKRIDHPEKVERLDLLLKNLPPGFAVKEGRGQKIIKAKRGDEGIDYHFRIERITLPDDATSLPARERDLAIYLAADHVINSDEEAIVNKAREIVGDEKNTLRAAEKIYRWVYENIDKKLIDTVSALDTLKSGEGECQAHSNLFAALARSAGIPAKVVSGIVYSREFEGFMYHAWNEVYAGEWISLDATLGEFPANATHVKLAEGGLAEQLKVMALVGRVGAEVTDIKYAKE